MNDYHDYRLEKALESLEKLTTRKTTTVGGISSVITVRELQGILLLGYKATLRLINKELKPLGGVVRVGKRLLIHSWAVNRMLNMTGRCPECGRPWDDIQARLELDGELSPPSMPELSAGGLRPEFAHRKILERFSKGDHDGEG